jgi:hypothetical protein
LPLGVIKHTIIRQINPTYTAQCNNGYGIRLRKTFKTISEAKLWYSTTKTEVVRQQADRALAENAIELDVYNSLVDRKF